MTSKATKRKHVEKEVTEDYVLPEGDQEIVRVTQSVGNNLHQVENSAGDSYLVSMPTKFRRNVWIKRDDFIIVTPIDEGDKVKAEITTILYKPQIKYIQENKLWPVSFTAKKQKETSTNSYGIDADMLPPSDSDSDNETADFVNPNRPVQSTYGEEMDSESEEESS